MIGLRRQIEFRWAEFSAEGKNFEGLDVVLCRPELADSDIANAQELAGKMAVVRRGGISFQEKAERVVKAGALALVIVNTEDTLFEMPPMEEGYVAEIPVMMIRGKDEEALLAAGDSSCLYSRALLMTLKGHR